MTFFAMVNDPSEANSSLVVRPDLFPSGDGSTLVLECVAVHTIDAEDSDAPLPEGLSLEKKDVSALHPIGRLGRVEEVAEAVLWRARTRRLL